MKLTYLGHASVQVEFGGKVLLFDPFISANELASHIDVTAIKADYILITHGHQDHVLDVEQIAKRNKAKIISNFEIVSFFEKKGFEGHPMNHGGSWNFEFGTVKYVNAIHSSSFPDGSYAGNPGGFVLWNEESCFYFAGDTALTMDMKLIPMTCPPLDFCILPIGDNFTMGTKEAILASEFVKCSKVVGCHFDTFGYIKIDQDKTRKAFNNNDIELHLLDVGATLEIA